MAIWLYFTTVIFTISRIVSSTDDSLSDDLLLERLSNIGGIARQLFFDKNLTSTLKPWWQNDLYALNSHRNNTPNSVEHRLFTHLFEERQYRRNIRPMANHNERLYVSLGICIMSIDEILENQDPMVTSGCVKLKWFDEYLTWDPAEYGNVTTLVLPSSEIWLPDIALINSAEPYITNRTSFVEVNYMGSVGFYPSGRFSTKCKISLTFFPFDRQVCEMQFESWTYPIEWIEIVLWPVQPVDVKDFYRNHQWDLDRVDAVSGKAYYDGFEFSTMRFVFHVRRRTLHYIALYIFPCVLISVMQVMSHSLPVEHPARITLLTGIFVAQSVIQSSLTSQTPKSSDGISLTQLYIEIFTGCMLFSMVITFINMHVWFRVRSSPLLAKCASPSLGVLLKSFFFWDVRSHEAIHFHYDYYDKGCEVIHPMTGSDTSEDIFGTKSVLVEDQTSSVKRPRSTKMKQSSTSPSTSSRQRYEHRMKLFMADLRKHSNEKSMHSEDVVVKKTSSSSYFNEFDRRKVPSGKKRLEPEGISLRRQYNRRRRRNAIRRLSMMPDFTQEHTYHCNWEYGYQDLEYSPFQEPLGTSYSSARHWFGGEGAYSKTPSICSDISEQTESRDGKDKSSNSESSDSLEEVVAKKEHKDSWIRFCTMLDKVCMYVFLVSNVISPFCIFILVPHTYNRYLESFDEDAHNATSYFYETDNIKIHYFQEFHE